MAFIDNGDGTSHCCDLCYQPSNSWASALHRLKGKSRSRVKRIGKAKKKLGKICVSSVDHLLISLEFRRVIFLDRLSRILNDSVDWQPICYKNSKNVLTSDLWKLAALSSGVGSVLDLNTFYVTSLSAHISPPRKRQNFDRLHLSRTLGRGPSQQTPDSFGTFGPVMQKGFSEDDKAFLEMLSQMVDSPICSDLSIHLDSGVRVFAHRFILAAWNPERFLVEDNSTSITAPGMSKEALLGLLRALYTFDLSFLSSLSPEVEFTLDCWQMLDAVRSRIQSSTASSFSGNSVEDAGKESNSSNSPVLVSFPAKGIISHEVSGSDSVVDLFASAADSSALIGTSLNLLEHNAVAASHSMPHSHFSPSVEIVEPIDKLCHLSRQSVDLDADPPAFSDEYDASHAPKALLPLSFLEQRVTKQPDDADHSLLGITPPSPRNATPDHYLFFDGSVPTPAPLAKRLRSSADSVEEVGTAFSTSSQPVEISSAKDAEESGSSNAAAADDGCQLLTSLPQPLPTPPVNGRRVSSVIITNVPVTPRPAFDQMRTPELGKALSDYGVRCLPKRKAIQLLNHIYDELHPYVEVPSIIDSDEAQDGSKNTEASLHDCIAEVITDEVVIPPKPVSDPSTSAIDQGASRANCHPNQPANDTLRTRVWECLRNNDQLYFNIVTYVPLELDCVRAMLRDAGINIGVRRLSELLDSWGVTFTTRSRHAPRPGTSTSDPRTANYLW